MRRLPRHVALQTAVLCSDLMQMAIDEAAMRTGIKLTVRGFARLQAGEGVDREAADFAREVASLTKG